MALMGSAAVRNGPSRWPDRRRSSHLPQLHAAQNPGGVVDDRDALQHGAPCVTVDAAAVPSTDVEVVEEEQLLQVGDGLAHAFVPRLVTLVLARQLTQLVV